MSKFEQHLNEELQDLKVVGKSKAAIDPTGVDKSGHIMSWPFKATIYKFNDGAYFIDTEDELGTSFLYKNGTLLFRPPQYSDEANRPAGRRQAGANAFTAMVDRYILPIDKSEERSWLNEPIPASEIESIVNILEDSLEVHIEPGGGSWVEVEP